MLSDVIKKIPYRYFLATVKHKWFVLLVSFKVRLPIWRAVVHDWSKFLPGEMSYHNRQHFGDMEDPAGYAMALLRHWNSSPHHYQYWADRSDHSGHYREAFRKSGIVKDGMFKMPEVYIREMIADWMGASMAQTGSWDMQEWLAENLSKMHLHPETRNTIFDILWKCGLYIETGHTINVE